ncbi:MAG TPA: LLM class flavin-dependent oxidoreductase [Ktedonobacteraceae bacterium]|jgi:alkanesulfonate monooxygenase SsuD/methylene tetrahydromethanopterin reductase-like flavin-dependent oxidoreductase (luciferase family)|nr:LLM class flavin-dependent oxidoreductase [Ktedonobacteraceae bacterium]
MYFAINTPNFGTFGDPRLLAQLAEEAEVCGWDGFFIWDHVYPGPNVPPIPAVDPWVALAAMAMMTSRIKLSALVTPIPRRRPGKLAREIVSLDHLSHGRVILGLGIGTDRRREYSGFHESTDSKQHAEMLDEMLQVLTGLWSGEPFSYDGTYYQVHDLCFLPKPVQQPRIPIWLGGTWPHKKPFRRAAQWDGITPIRSDRAFIPEDYHEISAYIKAHRTCDAPFDMVTSGKTGQKTLDEDRAMLRAYAEAGVTWWQENLDWNMSVEQVRSRIQQGPIRL